MKKGILNVDNTGCSFCGHFDESVDHLFLQCEVSWSFWCEVFQLWGLCWTAPKNLLEMFDQLGRGRGVMPGKTIKRFWFSVLFSGLWTSWLERNRVVEEEE